MNLNNFTIKAQEAMAKAQQVAFDSSNPAIDTDHLLKALLSEEDSPVEFLLKKNNVNVAFVDSKLDEAIQKLPKVNGGEPAQTISRELNNAVLRAGSDLKQFGDEFVSVEHLLLGLVQIAIMLVGIRMLERRWPVEPVTDPAAVRVDVFYTLIHRLGLVHLLMFFSIEPVWDWMASELRLAGLPVWQLDGLWPGVTDIAWVSLLLYLVVFDFVGYWLHRAQHQLDGEGMQVGLGQHRAMGDVPERRQQHQAVQQQGQGRARTFPLPPLPQPCHGSTL